jgi:hypothetical protein
MGRHHPQIDTEEAYILYLLGEERADAEMRLRYLRGHPNMTVKSVSTAMAREWDGEVE